jgi:hypothetical protein
VDERKLRAFLLGTASAKSLAKSIEGSIAHPDTITSVLFVRELNEEFRVTRAMATALCDAVLRGELPAAHLQWIGFALVTSESFVWDEDDLLAMVFDYWAAPMINLPLTSENVRCFKAWIEGAELYPAAVRAGHLSPGSERLTSVVRRRVSRFPKVRALASRLLAGTRTA